IAGVGSVMFKKLDDRGYPKGFSAALVGSSSVLGMLIPPSAIMILYAWIANQSVLAAFLSTVVPGLILAVLLSIFSLIYLRKDPNVRTIEKAGDIPFQPRKRLSLVSWV